MLFGLGGWGQLADQRAGPGKKGLVQASSCQSTQDAHSHWPVAVAKLLESCQHGAEEQAPEGQAWLRRGVGEWGGSAGGSAWSTSPARLWGWFAFFGLFCGSLTAQTGVLPHYFQAASV